MNLYLDCIHCMFRQVLQAARFCGVDEDAQEHLLRESMRLVQDADWRCTPMQLAQPVLDMVKAETGIADPYAEVKRICNAEAERHAAHVHERIQSSTDPVGTALKAAVGGNIIDYGSQDSFNLDSTMDRIFSTEFAVDDESKLKDELARCETIGYMGDNAGEIVFDRILLETVNAIYGAKRIVFAVRDQPLLNDALIEDAEAVGLRDADDIDVVEMAPNIPAEDSPQFDIWRRLSGCDVIISKGQGNYEGFSSVSGIYFLLMAKCELIARDIGARAMSAHLRVGDMILWRGTGLADVEGKPRKA